MRDTVIKDFIKIINLLNIKCDLTGMLSGAPRCDFPNGSFIRFIGLDKEDVGKGLRSDIVFVNEANKTKFDTYRELTSRAKKIIIDFNPNNRFWFHKEIQTREDCDFLKLTYIDNEFLSAEERTEILLYKEKGFNEDGTVRSQYWANMWKVYGLGEIGTAEGRIYNWKPIDYLEFLKIPKKSYFGCDWGRVDPFAIVEVKYHDGNLYVHEHNYASENEIERTLTATQLHQIRANEEEGLVTWLFTKLNVPKKDYVICDSNRPNKIIALRRAGWEYCAAIGGKSKLLDRINTLNGLNIYYTNTSTNIEYEQENYCYGKDKNGTLTEEPIDQDNHTCDAIAYVVDWMFKEGIIRKV